MHANYTKDLEALRDIISEFIEHSDEYDKFIGNQQNLALDLYKAKEALW
ncbi:MAG: hypothetical protein LBC06_03655 [Rickettsiales bacterium]|jgi:hypothetical protein|nr:hypothetical protein [Rickettsiales bacterium]